jgi:signal peptidase I
MNHVSGKTERKKWIAALLSIILPGLGQAYTGELLKGFCFLIFFAVIPMLLSLAAMYLPNEYLAFGLAAGPVAALIVYVLSIILASGKAGKTGKQYTLKPYNSWYAYTAIWLAALVLMAGIDNYMRHNVVRAYKIVSLRMAPQVLQGDRVIADLTAYKKHPLGVGDIVIVVYPDDRSKVLIRRIEGLPGDRITDKDGKTLVVPHGSAYILRNSSADTDKSWDSEEFGPVDLRDVVGKVRLVYFSKGVNGIRWSRIGKITPFK